MANCILLSPINASLSKELIEEKLDIDINQLTEAQLNFHFAMHYLKFNEDTMVKLIHNMNLTPIDISVVSNGLEKKNWSIEQIDKSDLNKLIECAKKKGIIESNVVEMYRKLLLATYENNKVCLPVKKTIISKP